MRAMQSEIRLAKCPTAQAGRCCIRVMASSMVCAAVDP
jgi:hypothetical protein